MAAKIPCLEIMDKSPDHDTDNNMDYKPLLYTCPRQNRAVSALAGIVCSEYRRKVLLVLLLIVLLYSYDPRSTPLGLENCGTVGNGLFGDVVFYLRYIIVNVL